MAIVYSTATQNARMQALADAIADGGKLRLGNTLTAGGGGTFIVDFALGTVATNMDVTNGVLTFTVFSGGLEANAVTGGTINSATLTTSANAVIASGIVVSATGGGGDIQLDATTVVNGQTVRISAFSITHG